MTRPRDTEHNMLTLNPMIIAVAAFENADKKVRCMAINDPRRGAAIARRAKMLEQMKDVAAKLSR